MVIPKFKVLDFDKYKGTTSPKNHLKMYYRKMGAYAKDEELLIHSFQESLTRVAVTWYTNLEPSRVHSWKDLMVAFVRQCRYNGFGYDATTKHVQKGGMNISKNTPKGGKIWQLKWHLQ